MVQFVRDHGVFLAEQRFEQTAVGVKARAVQDRVLGAQKFAQLLFQLFVHALGSADKSDRGHAVAPLIQGRAGRFDHRRMLGQSQIVIGAHIQNERPIPDANMGVLRRCDHTFALEQAVGANLGQLVRQMLLHRSKHFSKHLDIEGIKQD